MIWNCVHRKDQTMPKEHQKVDLVLLQKLMLELKVFIDFYQMKRRYEVRSFKESNSEYNYLKESITENPKVSKILKRFSVLNPLALKATIARCE